VKRFLIVSDFLPGDILEYCVAFTNKKRTIMSPREIDDYCQ